MASNLQLYNTNSNLQKWSAIVKECRSSGLSAKEWCKGKGFSANTYYKWQKRVFNAAEESAGSPEFAEIVYEGSKPSQEAIARITRKDLEIDILSMNALLRILEC